jgi:hypothetical protein
MPTSDRTSRELYSVAKKYIQPIRLKKFLIEISQIRGNKSFNESVQKMVALWEEEHKVDLKYNWIFHITPPGSSKYRNILPVVTICLEEFFLENGHMSSHYSEKKNRDIGQVIWYADLCELMEYVYEADMEVEELRFLLLSLGLKENESFSNMC